MIKTDRDVAWDLIAHQLFFKNESDMLTTLYQTSSIPEIAKLLKTSNGTILRRMEIHKIARRRRGGIQQTSSIRYKMFHVDQRIVMILGLKQCAALVGCSTTSLYKYKQWKHGRLTEMSGTLVKE